MAGDDGSSLLTGDQVGGLLDAAVRHAGGSLLAWELDHVDANPGQSTTATYLARVAWPHGEREEMLGVSARATGLSDTDARAEIFADGDREVAVQGEQPQPGQDGDGVGGQMQPGAVAGIRLRREPGRPARL